MASSGLEDSVRKLREQCTAAVGAFMRELQKVRTGRASSGLIEGIIVDYYGAKTSLKNLAQISAPEPRSLMVQVYDVSAIDAISKSIQNAGLGLSPAREGNIIRVSVAQLTEETRREIVKRLHKMAEDAKVSIRNHRRDANDQLKKFEKEGVFAKDDIRRALEKIQKQVDDSIVEVDKHLTSKEAECMEV